MLSNIDTSSVADSHAEEVEPLPTEQTLPNFQDKLTVTKRTCVPNPVAAEFVPPPEVERSVLSNVNARLRKPDTPCTTLTQES